MSQVTEIMMRSRLEVQAFGAEKALKLAEAEAKQLSRINELKFDANKAKLWKQEPLNFAFKVIDNVLQVARVNTDSAKILGWRHPSELPYVE